MLKAIKRVLLGLLVLILVANIYLLATGQTYVYTIFQHTLFKGKLSPSIDDHAIFPHRLVEATNPSDWALAANYNKASLNDQEQKVHKDLETVGFLVVQDAKILHEEYWDGYSKESATNSWSMAKSFIGHLIGVAVQEGKIKSINDKVSTYIPEYNLGEVKIVDLLSMSSGIDFDEDYLNPFSYPARSLFDTDIKKIHEDYVPSLNPGEVFDYQSGNSQLLGLLIEKVAGMTISEYASKHVWGPIGASRDAIWSLDQKDGIEKAFCCFNSNVRDFAKFGQFYLDSCKINGVMSIPEDYYLQSTQPADLLTKEGKKCTRYGLHWWTMNYKDLEIFYARGLNGQYILMIPEKEMVVVRLGRRWTHRLDNGHPEEVYKYLDQAFRIVEELS